ncbi:MAG: hypothetical protein ACT4SY_11530 [Hyphomicrobiales bacterium]
MIRYSLFVLTVIATAASAIAAIAPIHEDIDLSARNVTVIEKNQAFPVYGPIVVEDCANEDCSEVHT